MSSWTLLGWESALTGLDLGVLFTAANPRGFHWAWSSFLDFVWAPLPPPSSLAFSSFACILGIGYPHHCLHLPSPLFPPWPLIASRATCMVDRALVEDLRGFERRLEDLLRDLRQLSVRAEVALASSVSDTRSEAWDFVSTPRPTRRETPPSSSHDYNNLARELPQVPDFCVRLCANLSGYQSASGKSRAERAWEAGFWAKCALEGRIRRPRPSWPLDLRNQFYVVLKAEGYPCPLVCNKAADYRAILQDFEGDTLSHAFPSQAEARVYCQAAGVPFPETIYQWTSRR